MEQMLCGQLRNSEAMRKTITVKGSQEEWETEAGDDPELTGVEQTHQTSQRSKSFTAGNRLPHVSLNFLCTSVRHVMFARKKLLNIHYEFNL